ncbi:MAG TPA: cupin-like domain-containing protein [Thermoanaerobaculia bacterium]|nr:cupin-like domain-containing protein [Thermoanaerobaculia bacterium]
MLRENAGDNQLLTQLFGFVASGYEPDGKTSGTCQVLLNGPTPLAFHLLVGETLTFGLGLCDRPSVTLKLPASILERVLGDSEKFDPRDRDIMSAVEISGDENLAALVSNLLKSPPRQSVERLAEAEATARASKPVTSVERVTNPTGNDVLEAIREGRPIVATGAIEQWEARSWSLADWTEKLRGVPLRVRSTTEFDTILDYVKAIRGESSANYSVGVSLPQECGHYFVPPFFNSEAFNTPQLWMGAAAGQEPVTALHRDCLTGVLCHLYGRKKFLLYSPDQAELVYPFKRFNAHQPCRVAPSAPDLERYPLFAKARPIETVLEPGDVLINPVGWFHEVYALGPVISVSFFLKGSKDAASN